MLKTNDFHVKIIFKKFIYLLICLKFLSYVETGQLNFMAKYKIESFIRS